MSIRQNIYALVLVVSASCLVDRAPAVTITLETFEDGVKDYTNSAEDIDHADDSVWAEFSEIINGPVNVSLSGQEGSDYFYGQNLQGSTESITFTGISLAGLVDGEVKLLLAANTGVWDTSPADSLSIALDKDNNGSYETILTTFLGTGGSSDFTDGSDTLNTTFQDLSYSLPNDVGSTVGLRISLLTSSDVQEGIGVDNIRIEGDAAPVPEPSSAFITVLGILALRSGRKCRKQSS